MSPDEAAAAVEMAREQLLRGVPVRFIARGASMHPFVRDGDQIEVHPPQGRLRAGDLVLLRVGDFGVVHRIFFKAPGDLFAVKGDAMPRLDGWFQRKDLMGRVSAVRRDGERVPLRRWRALLVSGLGGVLRQTLPWVRRR